MTRLRRRQKLLWTGLSLLAFAIFVIAISLKIYWLNVFVIILGLLFKYYGSELIFAENKNKRLAIKADLIAHRVIKVKKTHGRKAR
jgi:23S rRNA maturation-related 3'-5' exoribonuclease YhaM